MIAKEIRQVVRMTSANMDPAMMFRQRYALWYVKISECVMGNKIIVCLSRTDCTSLLCSVLSTSQYVSLKAFIIVALRFIDLNTYEENKVQRS